MSTWVKEAREKSRKSAVSPTSGRDYVIRKITSSEILEAGMMPLLAEKRPEPSTEAAAVAWFAAHANKMEVAEIRTIIESGTVSPKISYQHEDSLPEDTVHARWISDDENWLYLTILEFSGIANETHREKLEAILKNGHGSSSSTPSPDAMAASLTNS